MRNFLTLCFAFAGLQVLDVLITGISAVQQPNAESGLKIGLNPGGSASFPGPAKGQRFTLLSDGTKRIEPHPKGMAPPTKSQQQQLKKQMQQWKWNPEIPEWQWYPEQQNKQNLDRSSTRRTMSGLNQNSPMSKLKTLAEMIFGSIARRFNGGNA